MKLGKDLPNKTWLLLYSFYHPTAGQSPLPSFQFFKFKSAANPSDISSRHRHLLLCLPRRVTWCGDPFSGEFCPQFVRHNQPSSNGTSFCNFMGFFLLNITLGIVTFCMCIKMIIIAKLRFKIHKGPVFQTLYIIIKLQSINNVQFPPKN